MPTKPPGKPNELAMPETRAATQVQMAIVIGVAVAGVISSGLGVWLVYLGKQGQETINILGQQGNTNTTGILAIFIGAVAVVAGAILRVLR